MTAHTEVELRLGPCCICEADERVRNVLMLGKLAPIPGRGWGCVQCGLALDGAIAVVCDGCIEQHGVDGSYAALRFACRGYPAEDGRIPIGELVGEAPEHRREFHPELEG